MPKDDLIRIRHMLESAREAITFAKGKKRSDLDKDRMLILSLVKSIEIVGEAAAHVSKETRKKHPEIPWSNIVAMRNRLIHVFLALIQTGYGIL